LVTRPLFLSRFYCRSEGVSQPSHQKLRFQPLRRKKFYPEISPDELRPTPQLRIDSIYMLQQRNGV